MPQGLCASRAPEAALGLETFAVGAPWYRPLGGRPWGHFPAAVGGGVAQPRLFWAEEHLGGLAGSLGHSEPSLGAAHSDSARTRGRSPRPACQVLSSCPAQPGPGAQPTDQHLPPRALASPRRCPSSQLCWPPAPSLHLLWPLPGWLVLPTPLGLAPIRRCHHAGDTAAFLKAARVGPSGGQGCHRLPPQPPHLDRLSSGCGVPGRLGSQEQAAGSWAGHAPEARSGLTCVAGGRGGGLVSAQFLPRLSDSYKGGRARAPATGLGGSRETLSAL